MNKIKIPKNWVFKYFEVEGNTTKFVYEDQLGIEHIYINKEPEPELSTYEELQDKYNKQKEVLDKIKEYCNEQIKLANIEIDECCRWRNADKEKYIITETNLSKAFLIKKCNKRILRVMDLVENDKYYNAKQIYEEELLEEIE